MAVIDKVSGKGFVQVSTDGYSGERIDVYESGSGSGYATVKIEAGQHCMVYGCVLYFIL